MGRKGFVPRRGRGFADGLEADDEAGEGFTRLAAREHHLDQLESAPGRVGAGQGGNEFAAVMEADAAAAEGAGEFRKTSVAEVVEPTFPIYPTQPGVLGER